MSQQINLINPALIKQKDFLTSAIIGFTYLALVAVLLGWYVISANQVASLTKQRDQAAQQLLQVQTGLTQATAARVPREPSKTLLSELVQLEGKHKVQTQILETINQSQSTANRGLAAYMRGFARQTIDGLWLTGFTIDSNSGAMTIHGRSLRADILPQYISRLGNEPVFAGQSFGGLHMQQPVAADEKTTKAPASNIPVAATAKTDANPAAGAVPAEALPVIPSFIEFELQAVEDQAQDTAEARSSFIKTPQAGEAKS